MSLELTDKTAVVTGAASGIGQKSAVRFAEEGANVIVADVDVDAGEETVDVIESGGGEATFVETDVSNPEEVEEMVDTAVETYGSLDVAHNNAGIEGDQTASLAEFSIEEWEQITSVDFDGVWYCLKYEIEQMTENGGGAIVNTSSVAGLSAAGNAPYAASKHGVIGLSRVAASEYAEENIRVNAVCPGVIDTPMVDRAEEQTADLQMIVQMQPIARKGTPEEVANLVVWLCSEEASFVTGNAYPVDGGFMAL